MTKAEMHYVQCQDENCEKVYCVDRREFTAKLSRPKTPYGVNECIAEYIKAEDKGRCLIPRPGAPLPSCHEKNYCECDMVDAMRKAASWKASAVTSEENE